MQNIGSGRTPKKNCDPALGLIFRQLEEGSGSMSVDSTVVQNVLWSFRSFISNGIHSPPLAHRQGICEIIKTLTKKSRILKSLVKSLMSSLIQQEQRQAWVMSLFLAITSGRVTAVNPMRQSVAVLEHKIQFHYVLKNSIFYART